jgi:hypothetical protein
MSTGAEPELEEEAKWSLWAWAAAALLVLLFAVIGVGIFRGCFAYFDPQQAAKRDEEQKKKEQEEKEKEKKKDFEIKFPVVQPSEPEAPMQFAKPGHWATATQTIRANFKDFVGDSRTAVTNSKNVPFAVASTPFTLRSSRPVLLSKGRPKSAESSFFVPQTDQTIRLSIHLEERGIGLPLPPLRTQVAAMPSYQYHMVVLAKEASRYTFLKTIDAVQVPFGGETDYDEIERNLHYRVEIFDVRSAIALSDNPLTWTSIAYIVWDECDPGLFTPEQERALVDWLHWGGQLIISGPDSLDTIKGSFLDPYLPAESGGPRVIKADDPALAEVNDTQNGWLISTHVTQGEPLKPTVPWSAVKLEPRPASEAIPSTGGLIMERRAGRGRVVVTAMQLAERDLINWKSGFESMFNAALLRRPERLYKPGSLGPVTLAWADPDLGLRRLDAQLTTNVRYMARDLGVETAYRYREVRDQFNQVGQQEIVNEYVPPAVAGGIGAWNDFSATANAAREALREAAGVDVPGAGFVVMCLAVYLVALVPLNWLVFSTVGRTEWAWIAAPIIAIVGTVTVVNQAQLDIGFVRAQTEIGLLEQQPAHPRAHLSRYTALYTSLSTTYDLEFPNLTSLAAPFPTGADYQMLRGQGLQSVDFQRYDDVRLVGVPVSSNSTGMVHSEQMIALDGPLQLGTSQATGGRQVENRTKLKLQSACVVKRTPRGLEGMWIGEFSPGKSLPLVLSPLELEPKEAAFASDRSAEGRVQPADRLNLEPMFRLALDPQFMEEGETRLIARVDEVMPGQSISPSASQVRGATLVVAHLGYARLPRPKKDHNTRQDMKGVDLLDREMDMDF